MIELKNLSINYKDRKVIENLSYSFHPGEITVIYGNSGTGKTTLLNTIGLLHTDYCGNISINGNNNSTYKKKQGRELLRRSIGFVFQNYGLIDNKTVYENIKIGMKYIKLSDREKREMVEKELDKVGLKEKIDMEVYKLSGGEQQRVSVVRAILKESSIILADEPTGSLDSQNKKVIVKKFLEMKKTNKIVIIVTHDKELEKIADHILNL